MQKIEMFISEQYEFEENRFFWEWFVEFKYEEPINGWNTCWKTWCAI